MSVTPSSTPALAITACTCALSPLRSCTNRARYRTSSPASRTAGGCDPRLRQPPETQQVRQIAGVAFVVLHPPLPPVVARRVRQMHREPSFFEQVDRPIPAIGRLDHHLHVL